jgi:hypothetical protein
VRPGSRNPEFEATPRPTSQRLSRRYQRLSLVSGNANHFFMALRFAFPYPVAALLFPEAILWYELYFANDD